MRNFRKELIAAALLGLAFAGPGLHAQVPTPADDGHEVTPDVTAPMEHESNLSPADMDVRSRDISEQAEADQKTVEALKSSARKQRDVIKLNCINDKLLQIKQLLNIIDDARSRLAVSISTGDEAERYHRFAEITISGGKITSLREEAEDCVGEEINYLGPLRVRVQAPQVPVDPTAYDPFGNDEVEPPGYASPFE